jgi:hypothetical protein
LHTEVVGVFFQNEGNGPDNPLSICLLSGMNNSTLLYERDVSVPNPALGESSELRFAYTTSVSIREGFTKSSITSQLGSLRVEWVPKPMSAEVINKKSEDTESSRTMIHGPLALTRPSTLFFDGPKCYVENAAFKVRLVSPSSAPKVAEPFEIRLEITNTSSVHQTISIQVEVPRIAAGDFAAQGNMLLIVAGVTSQEISIAPDEETSWLCMMIAMQPGPNVLPSIMVSSKRYNTWLANEEQKQSIFVLP